jgi:hypothetical protein
MGSKVADCASAVFHFMQNVAHNPHAAYLRSKNWVIENWGTVWAVACGIISTVGAATHITTFVKFVMRNRVIRKVLQKIKEALIATWENLKRLSLKQKLFVGALVAVGLWTRIIPLVLKTALGISVSVISSVAFSIISLVAVPLTLVGGAYLAYKYGYLNFIGLQAPRQSDGTEGREMGLLSH